LTEAGGMPGLFRLLVYPLRAVLMIPRQQGIQASVQREKPLGVAIFKTEAFFLQNSMIRVASDFSERAN
jgi:hypothetical protein